MLGVVADFMPSFWQQSTYNVSTNFNHTPSHHYWSQNPQETHEEIHKCLFHTSLSLQTHPQAPHHSPAQQRILLGHDYKISCVPGIKKKRMWWILHAAKNFFPTAATTPVQLPPPCTPGTNTNPRHPYAHQRERQQPTLKIC